MKDDALIPSLVSETILAARQQTSAALLTSVPEGHELVPQLLKLGAPEYFFELNRRRDGFIRYLKLPLNIDGLVHKAAFCAGFLAIGSPCSGHTFQPTQPALVLGDWSLVELPGRRMEASLPRLSYATALASGLSYHTLAQAFRCSILSCHDRPHATLTQHDLLGALERHFAWCQL